MGNGTGELVQTFLLVRRVSSEASHHQKRSLTHFFSVKCCEEVVLYNRVGVTVFITSWRATGLGVLTEWKNTCRSPVWSFARMGDSASAAGRAASSPGAGEAAKAVSHSAPQCVAPGGTSLAAVT